MSQSENPSHNNGPTPTDIVKTPSGTPAATAAEQPTGSSVPPPPPPSFQKFGDAQEPPTFVPSHATVSDYRVPEVDTTRRNAMYAYAVIVAVLGATLAMFVWTALTGMTSDSTVDENSASSKDEATAAKKLKLEPHDHTQILGSLPQFQLVRADGSPFSRADMDGTVWVVDFFFCDCPDGCPVLTSKMAELDAWLETLTKTNPDFANVKLLSITIDPERDTPDRLARYAANAKASKRWVFATGDRSVIDQIARTGFAAPGTESRETHSLRLYLVDHLGRVRTWYKVVPDKGQTRVTDRNNFERLKSDLWQRLSEQQNSQPVSES